MKTLLVVLVAVSISACGTISGIGKDIHKSAEWTKEKMGGSTK